MSGLQCWDASGKLIVDIGDYNCRYLGSATINIAANTPVTTGSFGGLTENGSFGVVVNSTSGVGFNYSTYAVRTYNGGYRVFYTAGSNIATTLTLNFYSFL